MPFVWVEGPGGLEMRQRARAYAKPAESPRCRGLSKWVGVITYAGEWAEELHPRDEKGRFVDKGHPGRTVRLEAEVHRREEEVARIAKDYPGRTRRDRAERQVAAQLLIDARNLLEKNRGAILVERGTGATDEHEAIARKAFTQIADRYPRLAAAVDRIVISDEIGWASAKMRREGRQRWIELNPKLIRDLPTARQAVAHELTHVAVDVRGQLLPSDVEEKLARKRGELWRARE